MNAGGTVNYFETDNAGLFGAWGGHEPAASITYPLNLNSSEIARELADYFDYIHQRSPETKFGIIENLNGWNFGEWKGKRSPVGGSQTGIEDILLQLNVQMRRKGLVLNHFTAELPWQLAEGFGFDDYQYKKMLAVADFCTALGIRFSKLYNPNSQTSSDEAFFNSSLQFYIKAKEVYGLKTSIDVFQSWIAFPTTIYGNSDPYSFTNIVKAATYKEKAVIIPPLSPIQINNDPGSCGAESAGVLGDLSFSEPCGIQSVKNNAPEVFPVGTTVVTWTVSDVRRYDHFVMQSVDVADIESPLIIAPVSPININIDSGSTGIDSTGVLGTLACSDNCGILSVTNDAPAIFPPGTTLVTWTVTDIHGNDTTAIQIVNVSDGSTNIEMIEGTDFLVYPNPAKSDLYILNDTPLESVKIYSISGSLIISKDDIDANEVLLDVSGLHNEPHLLEVNTIEGRMLKKIVIDRN
ncbi:MAG: T9SS type A sorting domain-containing protein [Bacteroidetes bacterium]|nr:T9SS type A sorting domain-containing protein [Bacteroidota bacterium]